jgi:hypothetical protein
MSLGKADLTAFLFFVKKDLIVTIRSLLGLVGVVVLALGSLASAAGADDLETLKREVELLRRENELLRKENDLLKKEVEQLKAKSGAKTAPGSTSDKPKDEIVGILWEISFLTKDGQVIGAGRFLAADGFLYGNEKRIGTYTEDGPRVRIDITTSLADRANGVYNLIQIEKNPPTYHGNMKNTRGEEAKVRLRILRD